MDIPNDLSSSFSFASSYLSNGTSCPNQPPSPSSESVPNPENLSLSKLSSSLEKLLIDNEFDYTDAEIIVEGISVGIHRCILAARSQFFHDLFKKGNDDVNEGNITKKSEGKPKYLLSELVPYGKVGPEAFNVFLHYLYTGTGKLKASPPDISTCVDSVCVHDACRPAIDYAVELMYASATFQVKELVLLVQRRLSNFIDKALAEDVIPILVAAFHCQLSQLLSECIQRVARSNLDDVTLEKELPYEVSKEIKSLRKKTQKENESVEVEIDDPIHQKRIRRIHLALDSDDVELVKWFLEESSNITLDNAFALHYAVAYCDPKVVKLVLSLGLADVNLWNSQGHTVLHVAARRKEPSVILALLDRGASAVETTLDGQTAVAICRRLTRPKDFNKKTSRGESHKDRMCIDVLERELRRNSMSGSIYVTSQLMHDDLHERLNYLEDRVAFAKIFFPTEAKLAEDNADAGSNSMHKGLARSKGSSGNLREVDLNENPTEQGKRLQARLESLIKTVETGRRYFPHCSEVLDKFLEDELDMHDLLLERGTPAEQRNKRRRYTELKDDFQKAFYKDMAENNQSGLSSSSSSTSPKKNVINHKARKK